MTWVLLHGFMGSPAMWAAVSDGLAPHLPGHGPQPWYPTIDSFDGAVDDLLRRLPSRFALAGYSMGARVALALCVAHPERVSRVVLVGVHPGLEEARDDRVRWDDDQARALSAGDQERFVDEWERLPLFATQDTLHADLLAAQRQQRLSHHPRGLSWAMRTLGLGRMPSYWQALRSLSLSVDFITGEHDTKFSRLAARAAKIAPRGQHRVIPNVGHNVVLEAPAAMASVLARQVSD